MSSQGGTVIKMPGTREAPKNVRSVMDTLLLTIGGIDRWKRPAFQREQHMTVKVIALIEELKQNGGVIPGIITLGKLTGETYLIDGQHRIAAFRESGLEEGYADVRICHFDSMAEMGEEFVKLNSALVRMKNEDILRGLEGMNPHLAAIRRKCPFIGYDHVRIVPPGTTGSKVLLSMAVAIRTWYGSEKTPTTGPSSPASANMLNETDVKMITDFFAACFEAWSNDKSNFKLWGSLNLCILMWLWRRVVLGQDAAQRHGGSKPLRLTRDQFVACMMTLSADGRYSDWLVGRSLGDRDRGPCYTRIRETFVRRLAGFDMRAPRFPKSDW